MEQWEKSRYISRIISGKTRLRINGRVFFVGSPSRLQRCLAEEIFAEQLQEARWGGAYDEDELREILAGKNIWGAADEDRLKRLKTDLENLKVALFESRLKTHKIPAIRRALEDTKAETGRLEILKHSHDKFSCLAIASAARQRFLLGCSVFYEDGAPYWAGEAGWEEPDGILDKIRFKLDSDLVSETQIRAIARSDPWATLWNVQKHCGKPLFDCSAVDLNDEQKSIIIWSTIYENIRNHPDNLQDDYIDDDDLIDGWMIIKRKEREKNHVKGSTEGINNEKIANAPEVFVMAESMQEVEHILNRNDEDARMTLKQRMEVIKKSGADGVSEKDLPDVKIKLRQEQMERFMKNVRQR